MASVNVRLLSIWIACFLSNYLEILAGAAWFFFLSPWQTLCPLFIVKKSFIFISFQVKYLVPKPKLQELKFACLHHHEQQFEMRWRWFMGFYVPNSFQILPQNVLLELTLNTHGFVLISNLCSTGSKLNLEQIKIYILMFYLLHLMLFNWYKDAVSLCFLIYLFFFFFLPFMWFAERNSQVAPFSCPLSFTFHE